MNIRKIWLTYRLLPCRGSIPEMTAIEAGKIGPASARPSPSLILAKARWTGLVTRSARLVVATDMLIGCWPPPATEPSRICTRMRRKLPALVGTGSSIELKMPIIAAVRAQPSLKLRPQGMASGLSRRSTSIIASSESTATATVIGIPSGGVPGTGSWVECAIERPLGILAIAAIMVFSE